MEWKSLSKSEALRITEAWQRMDKKSFDKMVLNWETDINTELDDEYKALRSEVIMAKKSVDEIVGNDENYKLKKNYYTDLFFGRKLYEVLKNYDFGVRMASNDQVWIYLCVKVFPDIVHKRYAGATKKKSTGETVNLNVNEERFWKTKRRIYLKVLWWYIFLSLQLDQNGSEDLDATVNVLKNNSTDEIVQIVERSGSAGYRVDVYRHIMKYYAENRDRYDNKRFRQVMALNTAKTQVIEPELMIGGVNSYVKELFDYFDK